MKSGQAGWWRKQLRVRPRVVVITLCLCAGVVGLSKVRPAPEVVTVGGTAIELGAQSAAPVRWKVKLLVKGYLEKVVCSGDETKVAKAKQRARLVLEAMPKPYRVELQAAAECANVDEDLLTFGNSFVDLGSRALGCRSTVVSGGKFLHAHNLDWDNLGGMAKWSVILTRRAPSDGRYRTVSVGFAGLVGALDIINEHGVALSFNQLGTGADEVTEPVFVMLRRIAEHCPDFETARRELLAAPPGMPFIVTLSSAKEREGAVFERWSEGVVQRGLNESGWVAAANGQQAHQHGLSCLGRVMKASGRPDSLAELKGVLRHEEVLAAFNLYSVIWDYEDNQLHLASGALPAAAGQYRKYELFEAAD